jgi:hypothetical protein
LADFPFLDDGVKGNVESPLHKFKEVSVGDNSLSLKKVPELAKARGTCYRRAR